MDYVGGVLLFVIGFLAAFLAARGWRLNRSSQITMRGLMDKGTVRLDLLEDGSPAAKGFSPTQGDDPNPENVDTAMLMEDRLGAEANGRHKQSRLKKRR